MSYILGKFVSGTRAVQRFFFLMLFLTGCYNLFAANTYFSPRTMMLEFQVLQLSTYFCCPCLCLSVCLSIRPSLQLSCNVVDGTLKPRNSLSLELSLELSPLPLPDDESRNGSRWISWWCCGFPYCLFRMQPFWPNVVFPSLQLYLD